MTNGELELHNSLIAILLELRKINQHFDKLMHASETINVKVNHD